MPDDLRCKPCAPGFLALMIGGQCRCFPMTDEGQATVGLGTLSQQTLEQQINTAQQEVNNAAQAILANQAAYRAQKQLTPVSVTSFDGSLKKTFILGLGFFLIVAALLSMRR